jgi:ureidoglycolate lyase
MPKANEAMSEFLEIRPLTKSAFAPFGEVIEADPASMRFINGGTTERFHALATAGRKRHHQPLSRTAAQLPL